MTTQWWKAFSSYSNGNESSVKPMPLEVKHGKISLITSKCFTTEGSPRGTTQLGTMVTTMGFLRYDLNSSTKRGWQVSKILEAIH